MKSGRAISWQTYYTIMRRVQIHNAAAVKMGLKQQIWPYEVLTLWQNQQWRCDNCRQEIAWDNAKFRYIKAPDEGGENTISNLRITCGRCK